MDGPTCQRRKSEGFCTFVGRQRGRKSFSAFKAVALPPRAFVFCPGTRVILLLLKACMQIAVWMHVHESERQRAFSRGRRWFVGCTVPTIFYGRRPILLFFHRASLYVATIYTSLHPAILRLLKTLPAPPPPLI